ncbi:LOW QUALITY PROTEIN: protein YIPF2-like [Myiozetetes cayanensis]|uniref:LOW QUALITY PROTEIN: protein YIPF2-like n=1 Tax=Myiozetetes cayanensis TaxID=478635 RepID=UPI00215F852A|nr:LOW QUALITY PROTEIN: protein YIPF2-like [Myiozetetes cayanensis]
MAAQDELLSLELPEESEALSKTPDPKSPPTTVPETPELGDQGDDADTAELLGGQRLPRSFWTLEYYQVFFDVDTQQVLERIKASVTPIPGKNFVRHRLRNNPDLYGPFWICATLALALAVSGNLSQLSALRGHPERRYSPHFHHVTVAATLIYCHAGLVPLALWGFLRWRRGGPGARGSFSLLETLCAYGYSLSAYVPAAVLWVVPVPWLQWSLLALPALLSASALAVTFWPPLRAGGRVSAVAAVATLVALHALLAVGCKLYFFQAPTAGPGGAQGAAPHQRVPPCSLSHPAQAPK